MNAKLSKKLRISDVARAIGATPKSVRLWLDRGLVEIHTAKPEGGGWTEYSFRDIAILALVRSLVDFGVDVSTASFIANKTINYNFFYRASTGTENNNDFAGELMVFWKNHKILLYKEEFGKIQAATVIENNTFPMDIDGFFQFISGEVPEVNSKFELPAVYLSIDVAKLLHIVFIRCNESVMVKKNKMCA